MRLVTFTDGGAPRPGVVDGDHVLDVAAVADGRVPGSLSGIIGGGQAALSLLEELVGASGPRLPLSDLRLLSPVTPKKNVFAVGRNYLEHVREGAEARQDQTDVPPVPVFFTKATTTVTGPGDVPYPSATEKLDWEAELAVVIGRGGRDIPAARALDHIFGYTAANDLSARDLQFSHTQWFKGKSLDGTCPLGPWIVTADEVPDPHGLGIECRVNGVVKQKSNTSLMIFRLPEIIEWLSAGLTLEPGDVILTGTPEGVGFARKPPEFLQPGDTVEVVIDRIGTLATHITDREAADVRT